MTDRLRLFSRALARVMDELPLIVLGLIAWSLIQHAGNKDLAGLIHDGVLAIITGILGYMKGRSDGRRSSAEAVAHPTAPPPAALVKAPEAEG